MSRLSSGHRPSLLRFAAVLLFLAGSVWAAAQPDDDLKSSLEACQALVAQGRYQEALFIYQGLLDSGQYEPERKKIEEQELRAKKAYYVILVKKAEASSGEKAYEALQEAADLNVADKAERGFFGYRGINRRLKDAVDQWSLLRPKVFKELVAQAGDLAERQLYDEASRHYEKALKLDRGLFVLSDANSAYRTVKGVLDRVDRRVKEAHRLIKEKKHLQAGEILLEARGIYPESERVRRGFAAIQSDEKRYTDRREEASELVTSDPEQAILKYEEASRIHPELARLHDLRTSIQRLRSLIEQRRGSAVISARVRRLLEAGNLSAAHDLLESEIELAPDRPELARLLAETLVLMGQESARKGYFRQAERHYAQARRWDESNQQAWQLYQRAKSFREIRRRARRLNSSPNCEQVRDQMQELLDDALSMDGFRYRWYGMDRLRECGPPLLSPEQIRGGLIPLAEGRAQEAQEILSALVNEPGAENSPRLHAYLAVAYLRLYFQRLGSQVDAHPLRDQALESFAVALSIDSNFQLSTRLFSPREIAVFEQVRRNRSSQAALQVP